LDSTSYTLTLSSFEITPALGVPAVGTAKGVLTLESLNPETGTPGGIAKVTVKRTVPAFWNDLSIKVAINQKDTVAPLILPKGVTELKVSVNTNAGWSASATGGVTATRSAEALPYNKYGLTIPLEAATVARVIKLEIAGPDSKDSTVTYAQPALSDLNDYTTYTSYIEVSLTDGRLVFLGSYAGNDEGKITITPTGSTPGSSKSALIEDGKGVIDLGTSPSSDYSYSIDVPTSVLLITSSLPSGITITRAP
jgi:hypothetical protein